MENQILKPPLKKQARGSLVEIRCKQCNNIFMARVADVKRGWAKFCSKSCKAINQEQRTGSYANYISQQKDLANGFSSAHQFDNCEK